MSDLRDEQREAARARLNARRMARGESLRNGRGKSERSRRLKDVQSVSSRNAERSQQSAARRTTRSTRTTRNSKLVSAGSGGIFGAIASCFGNKKFVIALIIVLAAIIMVVNVLRSCTSEPVEQEISSLVSQVSQEVVSQQAPEPEAQINTTVLTNLIGSDLTNQLIEASNNDEDARWIASHPEKFTIDGDIVQIKLLKLATKEPLARSFVRNFPIAYPATGPELNKEVPDYGSSKMVNGAEVPRLYQWDERWGYTEYSSTTFALTGCCPTAYAMVYQGLTGDTSVTPYDMGVAAQEHGFMTAYDGTDDAFLTNTTTFGIYGTRIETDERALRSALSAGQPVICNVGPGDFTEGGHYIVITSIDNSGKLTINDPFSAERSGVTWDVGVVLGQTKALFAFSE